MAGWNDCGLAISHGTRHTCAVDAHKRRGVLDALTEVHIFSTVTAVVGSLAVHSGSETMASVEQLLAPGVRQRRLAALARHITGRSAVAAAAAAAVLLPDPPPMVLPSGVEPWPSAWMPVPTYTHVPRFALSEFLSPDGAAFEHLEAEGFCVIKDMLQQSECEHVLDLMWLELEQRGAGIIRGQPETWGGKDAARWFGNQWGHSDTKWWVRGQPQFKRVWERIHSTDDLIVSFDGSVMWRPWGYDSEWRGIAQPLHTDGKDLETGVPSGIPQGCESID